MKSGWALAIIAVIVGPLVSGCSYIFSRDIRGSIGTSPDPLVGYMTFYHDNHYMGSVSFGTVKNKMCGGEFRAAKDETVLHRLLDYSSRRYTGTLICIDGRKGDFELRLRVGGLGPHTLSGTVGNDRFSLVVLENGYACGAEPCNFGDRWAGPGEKWNAVRRQLDARPQ